MRLAEKILTPFGRVFKIDKFFCMVLQPIMHALKGQQRLAQGKRSDTLGYEFAIALTPCKGKSILYRIK